MAVLVETVEPNAGIRHAEPETMLYLGVNGCLGEGTLYITESFVRWVCAGDKGLTLPYPNIILHAISRDHGKFPQDSIYIHTDAELNELPGVSNGHSNSSEHLPEDDQDLDESDFMADDDSPPVFEVFFVPKNSNSLNAIYDSMAACQSLHPDPNDLSPDEDFFEEESDYLDGAEAELQDLIIADETNGDYNNYEMDPERYEDAEEDFPDPSL